MLVATQGRIDRDFRWYELLPDDLIDDATDTAEVPPEIVVELARLTCSVLQVLRDVYGPVHVTSGWRPDDDDSVHREGRAADIWFGNASTAEVVQQIHDGNLPLLSFDRAAWYPDDGHLHIEVAPQAASAARKLHVARERPDGKRPWKFVTVAP